MDSKKSQEELERPAKVYQVDALHSEIVGIKKLLEDQNGFLKGIVTVAYLEERLKNMKEKFDAEMELMKQEYRPVLGNAKWAARTAIGAFATIMVAIAVAVLQK